MAEQTITHRADTYAWIDCMRGYAVLMVIFLHVATSLSGFSLGVGLLAGYGQMGVQMFFVASALTLANSWQRNPHELNRTRNFFIRRFFRIAPCYYAAIFFYMVYFGLVEKMRDSGVGFAIPERYDAVNIGANLLFLHGLVPSANSKIVPGGWSIGAEFLFYAMFPCLIGPYLAMARRSLWHALVLPVGLFIPTVVAWAIYRYSYGFFPDHYSFLYYNIITQLPVFACGLSAYVLLFEQGFRPPRLLATVLFISLTMLGIWTYSVQILGLSCFLAAISFVWFAVLLKDGWLVNRTVGVIGQLSFSMYLIHFVFAWHGLRYVNIKLGHALVGDGSLVVAYVCVVLLSGACAWVLNRFIEKPGMLLGKWWIKRLEA